MQIIPVIDLKNGQVVHAVQGNRDYYQPIHSTLSPNASIEAVISAFLNLHPFREIYIADLNALTGTGHHYKQISAILRRYPDIFFWVDAGFNQVFRYARFTNLVPVIGSESLSEIDLPKLKDLNGQYILSLDFAADAPSGPGELFENPNYWPDRVIIMTLGQVGSNRGPDFHKINDFRKRYRAQKFVAAGGIRNKGDLMSLVNAGIDYSLIASALHSGSIRAEDIAAV
ncbi:MAG: HisA/HisF-related TIM barrel protein [Gammaproteobacteria bacterium]